MHCDMYGIMFLSCGWNVTIVVCVWRFGNNMNLWKQWSKCIDLMKLGVVDDHITCMHCSRLNLYDEDGKNRVLQWTPLTKRIPQFPGQWQASPLWRVTHLAAQACLSSWSLAEWCFGCLGVDDRHHYYDG